MSRKLVGLPGGKPAAAATTLLTEEQQARRAAILQRIDPRGYGLFDQANFEGDDLYLLLAPSERGHSGEVKSIRIPSELVNSCDYLLATGATPFRNFSELAKSALVLLLRTVADSGRGDSKWRTSVRTINIGIARSRIMRKSQDIETYLESAGAAIREMIGRGDASGSLDLFGEVSQEIEKLDDGQWRQRGQAWVSELAEVIGTLKQKDKPEKKAKGKVKLALKAKGAGKGAGK